MHTRELKAGTKTVGECGSPLGRYFPLVRGAVFLAAFSAALALPVLAPTQEKEEERETALRMAHLSPDAPEVDLYVDDELVEALSETSFASVSPYLPLPAGTRNVKVFPAGDDSQPLLEADVDLEGGDPYTLAAVGSVEDGSLAARLYEDDDTPPAGDDAKLRVVHVMPDVGPATVSIEGGEVLFALPGFSNASAYVEVPAGAHALQLRPAGTDQAASIPSLTLAAGESYTAFLVGRAADGSLHAVLAVDDAGGSRPLPDAGGRGEPRHEEPGTGAGAEVPEPPGPEGEFTPAPILSGELTPAGEAVDVSPGPFDEGAEPELFYEPSPVQHGSDEVSDPGTSTTGRKSRLYQEPVRARENADDRPEAQPAARDTREPAGDAQEAREPTGDASEVLKPARGGARTRGGGEPRR